MRALTGLVLALALAVGLGGCAQLVRSADEEMTASLAEIAVAREMTRWSEVARYPLPSGTFVLLTGDRRDGQRIVGVVGFRPDGDHGSFSDAWDGFGDGEPATFANDITEDLGDGSGWHSRVFGLISDRRITSVRLKTEDGIDKRVAVSAPGYVVEVPSARSGIVQAEFLDANGDPVITLPQPAGR